MSFSASRSTQKLQPLHSKQAARHETSIAEQPVLPGYSSILPFASVSASPAAVAQPQREAEHKVD